MAQILPHLLTMIHGAPDGAVQGSGEPTHHRQVGALGLLCRVRRAGCWLAPPESSSVMAASTSAPELFWILIACFVAGSVVRDRRRIAS